MSMFNKVSKSFMFGQHEVTLTTGEIARQASGAVVVQMGDTVILDSPHRIPPFTSLTGGPTDHRLQVGADCAQWLADHKVQCVGFGDGVQTVFGGGEDVEVGERGERLGEGIADGGIVVGDEKFESMHKSLLY